MALPEALYTPIGIDTGGKHIFVIPDIHGNVDLFKAHVLLIAEQIRAGSLDPAKVVIVQLGDLINKGHDAAGSVAIADALKHLGADRWADIAREFGFDAELREAMKAMEGLRVTLLRGNHEAFKDFATHMISSGPLNDYASKTGEMLAKGLRETIRSYVIRQPAEDTDAQFLAEAVNKYPLRGKNGEEPPWTWSGPAAKTSDQPPSDQAARDFWERFRSVWTHRLQATGHLNLFEGLEAAVRQGQFMALHGGLPSTQEGMRCWRRPKTEPLLRVVPTEN